MFRHISITLLTSSPRVKHFPDIKEEFITPEAANGKVCSLCNLTYFFA